VITLDLSSVVSLIEEKRAHMPAEHALLAGISGIDASGKGYLSAQIAEALRSKGLRTALINADGWLNLPSVRFAETDKALNFYENALRLDDLFKELILPLRSDRSIHLIADLVHETATEPHQFEYVAENVDVILVEGIFLFKRRFMPHFDLRIWIDCPFETALERAVSRAQEGLDEAATIKAYKTIYFPAQSVHFELDAPNLAADLIFDNSSNFQH
jgi:uridine kinase